MDQQKDQDRVGPTQERIAELAAEFPVSDDGWIYRRLPDGKYMRWHRWKEWGTPGTNGKPYTIR